MCRLDSQVKVKLTYKSRIEQQYFKIEHFSHNLSESKRVTIDKKM